MLMTGQNTLRSSGITFTCNDSTHVQANSLGFQKSPVGKMAVDKHKVHEVMLVGNYMVESTFKNPYCK